MSEFPQNIDEVINAIGREYKIRIMKETHYDTLNRVLGWFENNIQKRIDLTCMGKVVAVTFYKDTFPFCPKCLIWLHNAIPLFPYLAKIEWERLDELSLNEAYGFYDKKLRTYIECAKSK